MARPKGRFDQQKEACYALLKSLAKPKCWASNAFLAKKLKCSERTVSRYLLALAKEGRVSRQQYRYSVSGNLKTKRNIYLKKSPWIPAMIVPKNRFVGYDRKVKKMSKPNETTDDFDLEAAIDKVYAERGVVRPKEATVTNTAYPVIEARIAARPRLAGVVFSPSTQAIIDSLPEEYR